MVMRKAFRDGSATLNKYRSTFIRRNSTRLAKRRTQTGQAESASNGIGIIQHADAQKAVITWFTLRDVQHGTSEDARIWIAWRSPKVMHQS